MDDVDGMFPTRSYQKLDAWYLGHLNVLFTEMDKLESDKVGIIMTTNRKDLLDDAVISRIVPYEIPYIDIETAMLYIEQRVKELKMDEELVSNIKDNLNSKITNKEIENLTFRDVEKEMMIQYVKWIEMQGD